ncbi:MAG: SirA-like domain-containing protein [Cycloclasticus sp. symbiont of Bathymodiolus heckerae]|nr:MAG: SirA-like domain-containing protein [Cycloclasticus sp. symbiont of Bathymodiolus heckerae]
MEYNITLDVKGLNCPLPLLRLKQLLQNSNSGDIIQMMATDPAAHLDVGVFIDKSNHEMLLHERKDEVQYFYIKISN